MFTRIRLHCESVLIRVRLILTFTLSLLNEYPNRTDLKLSTKVYTYRNAVFIQACNRVDMYTFALMRPCYHCHFDSSARFENEEIFERKSVYKHKRFRVNRVKRYRLKSVQCHEVKRTRVNVALEEVKAQNSNYCSFIHTHSRHVRTLYSVPCSILVQGAEDPRCRAKVHDMMHYS